MRKQHFFPKGSGAHHGTVLCSLRQPLQWTNRSNKPSDLCVLYVFSPTLPAGRVSLFSYCCSSVLFNGIYLPGLQHEPKMPQLCIRDKRPCIIFKEPYAHEASSTDTSSARQSGSNPANHAVQGRSLTARTASPRHGLKQHHASSWGFLLLLEKKTISFSNLEHKYWRWQSSVCVLFLS